MCGWIKGEQGGKEDAGLPNEKRDRCVIAVVKAKVEGASVEKNGSRSGMFHCSKEEQSHTTPPRRKRKRSLPSGSDSSRLRVYLQRRGQDRQTGWLGMNGKEGDDWWR